jgi:cytochrome c biogenesis protein CcmG/thiol:disulfide interchange protein DsbE
VPRDELEGYPRRRRPVRIAIAAAVLVAVAAGGYLALKPAPSKPVPDFTLPMLEGGGTLSSSELRGSPVVLNFFASWCIPCRDEARVLEAGWHAHRDRGVRFVGVNIQDTRSNARRFVREFGITYPVVSDYGRTLADALGVYGLPQTFFVDAGWRIASHEAGDETGQRAGTTTLGAITRAELERNIESLLSRR